MNVCIQQQMGVNDEKGILGPMAGCHKEEIKRLQMQVKASNDTKTT